MDDDFSFGASVWGAPDDPIPPIPPSEITYSSTQILNGFTDFDNLAESSATTSATDPDDEFGDFGDFGDAQIVDAPNGFDEQVSFEDAPPIAGPSLIDWQPLRLDPLPPQEELQEQIYRILDPIWMNDNHSQLTDEDMRQVEGLNQTLVSPERYLFAVFWSMLHLLYNRLT